MKLGGPKLIFWSKGQGQTWKVWTMIVSFDIIMMMILDASVDYPWGAPLLIWVKRSKVKVRFSIGILHHFHTVNLAFWLTIVVLHTYCVAYDPRRTPLDFLVKRSKVMDKLGKFEFVAGGGICPFRSGIVGPLVMITWQEQHRESWWLREVPIHEIFLECFPFNLQWLVWNWVGSHQSCFVWVFGILPVLFLDAHWSMWINSCLWVIIRSVFLKDEIDIFSLHIFCLDLHTPAWWQRCFYKYTIPLFT